MYEFAWENKDRVLDNANLVPWQGHRLSGGLWSTQPGPFERPMTVREAVDAMFMLVNEQQQRVDRQGKQYTAVLSKIFAPGEGAQAWIGKLTMYKDGGVLPKVVGDDDLGPQGSF